MVFGGRERASVPLPSSETDSTGGSFLIQTLGSAWSYSFGLLAIPLFVAIQYLAVRRPLNGFLYVLLVSLCISNAMNAGGVWVQMFFAAMLV